MLSDARFPVSSASPVPIARTPFGMGNGDDPHGSPDNAIDHAVGICLQDEAPCAPTISRPAVRGIRYQFEGVIERDQKTVSCLWAAQTVVHFAVGDISLRLR